jgi:hypothetical protein
MRRKVNKNTTERTKETHLVLTISSDGSVVHSDETGCSVFDEDLFARRLLLEVRDRWHLS